MANTIPQHGATSQQSGTSAQQGAQTGLVDKVAQTAEQAATKAVDRVRETRERANFGIEQQHHAITSRIRGLGDALRSSGRSLTDNDSVSSLLSLASDQVDRVADYVDGATPRTIARDIERFAREKPAWFFGGAFLAGLALGRFAKSSGEAMSSGSGTDGMQLSESDLDYPTGRYPQSRGDASSTYAGGSSYTGGSSTLGAGYSGYTSGGTATSGGYTGGSTGSTSTGTGGTTRGTGSSGYSTGSTSGSGYTGGTSSGTSGTSGSTGSGGTTLSGIGSSTGAGSSGSGYSTGSSGGTYSGSGASGSASNPSGVTTSTTTPNTRNGNGGTNGTSGAGRS